MDGSSLKAASVSQDSDQLFFSPPALCSVNQKKL